MIIIIMFFSVDDQIAGNKRTLLHLAVINNKIDFVKVLINEFSAGKLDNILSTISMNLLLLMIDIDIVDKNDRLPLHYLCEHTGNEGLVDLLANRLTFNSIS